MHEALLYDSDDEFLSVVVPFLEAGRSATEPTLVALAPRNEALVRSALAATSEITFLSGGRSYSRPAAAIRGLRERFEGYERAGVGRVRVVGEVLDPATPQPWHPWARYEAAINHLFRDFDLWGLCPYNTQAVPQNVIEDVKRTHPQIATADGGHVANGDYLEPAAFLASHPQPQPHKLEAENPLIELVNPTEAEARRAVATLSKCSLVRSDDLENLVSGASESVANARQHGRPPILLRAWASPLEVLITITDTGTGPDDPYAGLRPAHKELDGLGLWVTHQLCQHVEHTTTSNTFTIRLSATATSS